jgi:hypothetical protein
VTFEPRSADELRQLADSVIPGGVTEILGVYAFASDDPAADLARHVEAEVLYESFGNTPELLHEEYDRYESQSFFFCVLDHRRRRPAGVIRIIIPYRDGSGSKTYDDIERLWGVPRASLRCDDLPFPAGSSWDMATLAVSPEYRGAATAGVTALALYQSMLRASVQCGVTWGAALLDAVVYRMIEWRFESPFRVFDGLEGKHYLGSNLSLPVYSDAARWREGLKTTNPTMYDLIFEGVGLGPTLRGVDPELVESIVNEIQLSDRVSGPEVIDLAAWERRDTPITDDESMPLLRAEHLD